MTAASCELDTMTLLFGKLSSSSRRKDANASTSTAAECDTTSTTSMRSERSSHRSNHVVHNITTNDALVRMNMCPRLESDPVPASFKKGSHLVKHSHLSQSSLSSDSINGSFFQVASKSHSSHHQVSPLLSHSLTLSSPFTQAPTHKFMDSPNHGFAPGVKHSPYLSVSQTCHPMQVSQPRASADVDSSDEDNDTHADSHMSSLDSTTSCAAIAATKSNNYWNLPWHQHIVHMCPYCNRPVRPGPSGASNERERQCRQGELLKNHPRDGSISQTSRTCNATVSRGEANHPNEKGCSSSTDPVNARVGAPVDKSDRTGENRGSSAEACNEYGFEGIVINLKDKEDTHTNAPFLTPHCHAYCRCRLSKRRSSSAAAASPSPSLWAAKSLLLDSEPTRVSATSACASASLTKGSPVECRDVPLQSSSSHKHMRPHSRGGHGRASNSSANVVNATNAKVGSMSTSSTHKKHTVR